MTTQDETQPETSTPARRRFGRQLLVGLPLLGVATVAANTQTASAAGGNDSWKMEGNGNTDDNDFLGTYNLRPLVLKTNNQERMRITAPGNIGIGIPEPQAPLHLWTASEIGIRAESISGDIQTVAIQGQVASASGSDGAGVKGVNTGGENGGSGVLGTHAANGRGVTGRANGASGTGVLGQAAATAGNAVGVKGVSAAPSGNGVMGDATATSGSATGVFGRTFSPQGTGVYGRANSSNGGTGVVGQSSSSQGYGVHGKNEASNGVGVRGQGKGRGVEAISTDSTEGIGMYAKGGKLAARLDGRVEIGSLDHYEGLKVNGPISSGPISCGSIDTGNVAAGGLTTGIIHCAKVEANGMIEAINYISYSHAWFESDIYVKRNIVQGQGITARVDHLLDPANQYLNLHYTTSAEELSMLSGNARTDEKGFATITLPSWFEAYCSDFRYQLTCIGQFAQAIVKEPLARGQFVVQTELPAVQFSWQITAVRVAPKGLDPQAAHSVEVAKPADEQGSYLDPARFGMTEEQSLFARKRKELAPEPALEPTNQQPQP